MKFALVDGERSEATKGAKGQCPRCGSIVIARCGDINIHHWSHKGRRNCDPWWENETEWHRNWKNQFPVEWQEVLHRSKDGEKHFADVKTANEWVIEFQHSLIDPEERRARNDFYQKLVWVVDGMRRKTDKSQFRKAVDGLTNLGTNQLPLFKVGFADECRLIREWAGSRVPVFFDFMSVDKSEDFGLWCLLPGSTIDGAYVMPCSRESFITLHQSRETQVGSQFEALMSELGLFVSDHQKHLKRKPRSTRSSDFQRRIARKRRRL